MARDGPGNQVGQLILRIEECRRLRAPPTAMGGKAVGNKTKFFAVPGPKTVTRS